MPKAQNLKGIQLNLIEDLGPLIAEVDTLRLELGFSRWSHLRPWCDDGDPLTTDGGGLERLVERLSIVVANRRSHHAQ
jgi:hypothetical protein